MKTATYSELRANLKEYLNEVVENYESVVVNRKNGTGIVLISLDEYNSLKETDYIMSSRQTVSDIKRSEQEIREGKGIEVNVDEL